MSTRIQSHWLGTLEGHSSVLVSAEPFLLAGVEWAAPTDARIELRARTVTGHWTPWTLASVQGHDSDAGESRAHACFGEPVWTGPARELQLRSARRIGGLSFHLVNASILTPIVRGDVRSAPLAPAEPSLPAGPGQPSILARHAWAGNRAPASAPVYGDVRMMFVHHSVGANAYDAAAVPGILLSIYEFHRYVRGWNDIGYNFAIDAFGRIWEARAGGIDQAVVGAQAGGYNLESSGVVMLGTFSAVLPSGPALNALQRLLAWKLSLHGVGVSGVTTVEVDPSDAFYTPFRPGRRVRLPCIAGHRDGCTTDCPGGDLYGYLPVVRANVKRLAGTQLSLSLGFGPGQEVVPADYLSLASVRITVGETVTMGGALIELTGSGAARAPIGGATVEFQSLSDTAEALIASTPGGGTATGTGTGTGEVPLTATTAGNGHFATEFSPRRNVLVRALHRQKPAVASALVAIGVAPALTLAVQDPTPLTLTGMVIPRKAALELVVYKAGGQHALVLRERVSPAPDGSFRVRPRLGRGSYWIRMLARADALNLAGESPRLTLTV